MDRTRAVYMAFLLLLCTAVFAQLREYVALVEPVYHSRTLEQFSTCARFFASCDEPEIAAFFDSYVRRGRSGCSGSGWVHISPAGNRFLVTNAHVVTQAEFGRATFETLDGGQRVFDDVPIAYLDDRRDIAVLLLPSGSVHRGLELSSFRPCDGTPVYAVGFPGFNGYPLWQFSAGIVSNAAARINKNVEYLIQHTAPTDPGNSGGPLLVSVPPNERSPEGTGYAVVGMNTAVATDRQNTNFAIPSVEIASVISAADRAVSLSRDPEMRRDALLETARELRTFLAEKQPDCRIMNEYVAYEFVAERGLLSFVEVLYIVSNDARWMHALFTNPIDAMRAAISVRLAYDLGRLPPVRAVEAVSVEVIPRGSDTVCMTPPDAITRYRYAGRTHEVLWTWEYGEWRVRGCGTRDIVDIDLKAITGGVIRSPRVK